jgi:hypothetical protein
MKKISLYILLALILTSANAIFAQYPWNQPANAPVTWGELRQFIAPEIKMAREKGDSTSFAKIEQLLKSNKLAQGPTDSIKVAAMIRQQAVSMPKLAPSGIFAKLQNQVKCLSDTVSSYESRLKRLESRINIMNADIELAKDSLGQKIEQMKCGKAKKEEICREIDKLKIKKDELDKIIKEKKDLLEHN